MYWKTHRLSRMTLVMASENVNGAGEIIYAVVLEFPEIIRNQRMFAV